MSLGVYDMVTGGGGLPFLVNQAPADLFFCSREGPNTPFGRSFFFPTVGASGVLGMGGSISTFFPLSNVVGSVGGPSERCIINDFIPKTVVKSTAEPTSIVEMLTLKFRYLELLFDNHLFQFSSLHLSTRCTLVNTSNPLSYTVLNIPRDRGHGSQARSFLLGVDRTCSWPREAPPARS